MEYSSILKNKVIYDKEDHIYDSIIEWITCFMVNIVIIILKEKTELGGNDAMGALVLIIIAAVVVYMIIKEKTLWAGRVRNSIVTFAGQGGLCSECRHCLYDTSHKYSDNDYVCTLAKCDNVTEETRMMCFEKPKVTENDITEISSLGVWNENGINYIRQDVLGKAMTFTELKEYLDQLSSSHPEFLIK